MSSATPENVTHNIRGQVWRFAAYAMATEWQVFFDRRRSPAQADGAATAALNLLPRLEQLWSRFIPHSDISRLNFSQGRPVVVAPETWDLLRLCLRLRADTHGCFDPAYATPLKVLRALKDGPILHFDPASHSIQLAHPEIRLDLGAIGKGYALDLMGRLLHDDWDLDDFCLSAGGSTVLAGHAPTFADGWPVTVAGAESHQILHLAQRALSASGFEVRGAHIVDPRTGEHPVRYRGVWVLAKTGAEADALSTAFAVMTPDEVRQWFRAPRIRCAARLKLLPSEGGGVVDLGEWPSLQG